MQKTTEIMSKNTVTIVAFAFRGSNDESLISVLTRQRMSDGLYELPAEDILDSDVDYKDSIYRCLSRYNCDSKDIRCFTIDSYVLNTEEAKEYTTAYCVFLNVWPGPSYGTNWMKVSKEGVVSEPLIGNHDCILKSAVKVLCSSIITEDDEFNSAKVLELINTFVSSQKLESVAKRLVLLGETKVSTSGLSDITSDKLIEELESRTRTNDKGEQEQAHYVYNFWHAGQAVDIVVLATDYYVIGKTGYVDLKIPLIKRSKGVGKGWWGLPGGFITKQDFLNAGWDDKQTDFNLKALPEYRNALKDHERVVTRSARRILAQKTGITIADDALVYPLFVRDNPMRGTADGVPVIAETLLTVIGDYRKFEHLFYEKDSNVEDVKWFTIKRFLYNEGGNLIKMDNAPLNENNAVRISTDKRSPFDLRNNHDETDAFLSESELIVNYFKGKRFEILQSDDMKRIELFADHRDAIIDALQYVKEKTHTSTILADFLMKNRNEEDSGNVFEFGKLKLVYESILFPEETVRQNLHDMIVENEGKGNNGFLEKAPGKTRGWYRFNMAKFNEFLYRKVSIF